MFLFLYQHDLSAINDPGLTEEDMEKLIDGIASGLFAVCATMGVVPIIKCPKDNAAEQVAIVRQFFVIII